MYYLTGTTKQGLPDFMGYMLTPKKGSTTLSNDSNSNRVWACDSGAFSGQFNPDRFYPLLERMKPFQNRCLFVACPDVMLDSKRTLEQFETYAIPIRNLGYKVAFVAQDGQENLEFPTDFDWLFVGGSTEWKLSKEAIDCIIRAKKLGKHIHVGRVNSYKRWAHFAPYFIQSVDGNKMSFAPNGGLEMIIRWQKKLLKNFGQEIVDG